MPAPTGRPCDPDRLELFDALFAVLNGEVSAAIADPAPTGAARENFAFFEASGRSFDPTAAPGRDGAAG